MSTTALDPAAAIVAAGRELLEELQTLIDCGITDADQVPGMLDKLTALLRRTRGKVARRKPEPKPAQAVKVAAVATKPATTKPASTPATKQPATKPKPATQTPKPAKVTVPIPARRPKPHRAPAQPRVRQTPNHHIGLGKLFTRSVTRWAIVGIFLLCTLFALGAGVSVYDLSIVATLVASVTLTVTLAGLARAGYRRLRDGGAR